MKLVVAPAIASLLSLLVCASSCDDGKAPPQPAERGADAKAGADAKTPDAKAAADPKAAADAKAGADAKAVADAKAGADAKAPDAKAVEPTAGADAKAPAKPGVAVSSLYWADASTEVGRTAIDVIGWDEKEGPLVMKLGEENEGADGLHGALPADAKLPAGYAIGDEWIIATTTGEKRGKAVAYGAYGGASETHFIVVLDVVTSGLTARASEWTGPIPTLREAKKLDTTKGPGKALFSAIKGPMTAAAVEPPVKKALARKPIEAKHVEVIEGHFPNGFTHLVTLTRPLAKPEEIGAEHVGGLFLADATGRVEALFPPAMTINSDEFLYLVDLEGDGIDEVVYDDSYYEGSYRMLVTWDAAGRAEHRTLSGDGA